MAISYTQRNAPGSMSYNQDTGVYTLILLFVVQGHTATQAGISSIMGDEGSGEYFGTDWKTSHNDIPLYASHTHYGDDQWGNSYNTTVLLFMTGKSIELDPTTNTMQVSVIYTGRVKGTHRITQRTQMVSVPIYAGLDLNLGGTYTGIGWDGSGTTRDIPMTVYSVEHVISLLDYNDATTLAMGLAGSANEADWDAPWVPATGDATTTAEDYSYTAGSFIFMGISGVSFDRTTRTALLVYDFGRLGDRWNQAYYTWRNAVGNKGNILMPPTSVWSGTLYSAKIYPIAGTDEWIDVNPHITLPTWGSSFTFTSPRL